MSWQIALDVNAGDDDLPLFSRIAQAISRDIARGRLRPGQRLPGTRTLATSLAVNRNTIVAAIDELVAQGWLETRPASGCYVRAGVASVVDSERPRPLARSLAPRSGLPARTPYALPRPPNRRWSAPPAGTFGPPIATRGKSKPTASEPLILSGGLPDPRLFPRDLLARAYRRAVAHGPAAILDYGDPRGLASLRAALAEMLSDTRGLACGADDVLITHGSQMAIWLVGQALIAPGDRVAIESYGYVPAWSALDQHGASFCPVPVDGEGMRIDVLEEVLASGPIRAVYLTPHHQFPTMATLSAARRLRLMALAHQHGFAIIEDDYDNEFHYEGRPILPLASADQHGSVVYIGTLSKVLAPGLRIGYVVAPRRLIDRLAEIRKFIDRQGDSPTEAAVAELFEDGEMHRQIRRTRRIYHERRDVLAQAMKEQLGAAVRFDVPRGGMALWLDVDPAIDVDAWTDRARDRGVIFTSGRQVSFDGRARPHARVGYARADEAELHRAVTILAATARSAR